MINFEELSLFFSDIIKADSNPYFITSKEVLKENGEIKTKYLKEEISLEEVSSVIDLIINNESVEYIDYYPKTFIKKIFNIKNEIDLSLFDKSNFILISDKTKKMLNIKSDTYKIESDDKIIFGERGRLIYYEDDGKLFININKSKLKTIILT
jgi:predicted RND superfamily exporter protein